MGFDAIYQGLITGEEKLALAVKEKLDAEREDA